MELIEQQKLNFREIRKDFEVVYRFYSVDEGGRKSGPPNQLYKSDWAYEGDDINETGIYMIWPIFMDQNGQIIEPHTFVPVEGTAQMFIVDDELRKSFHALRLKPGVRGYFMEGPKRVAEATVTRILDIK